MNTDQWLTLGIYLASAVFTAVGFFIVREVRRNDNEKEQLRHSVNRLAREIAVIKAIMVERKLMRETVKFPSPPPHIGETA